MKGPSFKRDIAQPGAWTVDSSNMDDFREMPLRCITALNQCQETLQVDDGMGSFAGGIIKSRTMFRWSFALYGLRSSRGVEFMLFLHEVPIN